VPWQALLWPALVIAVAFALWRWPRLWRTWPRRDPNNRREWPRRW
jgi:hypothetical protein